MANEVRGIMIPVTNEKRVLLPNAIIAEVVSNSEINTVEGTSDWFLGNINWRGYNVPVISYDTLSTGRRENLDKNIRVAVIKSLGNIETMPYFGLLVKGVPRLQLVTQGDLQVHESESNDSNAIASKVTIQDEMSEIPNIRFIEYVLDQLLHKKAS